MAVADFNDVANLAQSQQWKARIWVAAEQQAYTPAQWTSVDPLVKSLAQKITSGGYSDLLAGAFAWIVAVYLGQTTGLSQNSTITDAQVLSTVGTAFPYVAGG